MESKLHAAVSGIAILLVSSVIGAQTSQPVVATPSVVEHFLQKVGPQPSGEDFYKQVPESLWEVYPQTNSLKESLLEYLRTGADGPQLGFTAIALIAFHDPTTVRPMLERAMDVHTHPATRWCLLNTAPYVLGMGDVMYMEDGKIDKESKALADELIKLADEAVRSGTGHAHAVQLRQLLDAPLSLRGDDYGLAIWHESAYLLGTLDLKDENLLSKALTFKSREVFQNVIQALGFAVNRDFVSDLKKKMMNEVTPAMEQAVGRKADEWWQAYLAAHPDGNWHDAVLSGFQEAGYRIEPDLRSAQSQQEFLRALADPNPIIRYNAYRLFNDIYGTHFDLDVAFFAGKYALSFLDPMSREKDNEMRMKRYWQNRLNPQTAINSAPSTAAHATTGTAEPSSQTNAPESLADIARRLKEQKKPKQHD